MGNYFQVNNDKNSVIINDEFKNLCFLGKYKNLGIVQSNNHYWLNMPVSGPCLYYNHYKHDYYLIVPCNPYEVLVAINGSGGTQISRPVASSRYSRWVFKLTGGNINDLEVYLFGYSTTLPKQNVGLAVYNESGAEVFNSNYGYMDVVDFIGNNQFPYSDNQPFVNKQYTHEIAIFPFNLYYYDEYDDDPNVQASSSGWHTISLNSKNNISLGYMYSSRGGSSVNRGWSYDEGYIYSNVLVINVSPFSAL